MIEPSKHGHRRNGSGSGTGSTVTSRGLVSGPSDGAGASASEDGTGTTTVESARAGATTRSPLDTRLGWLRTQLSVERTLMAWNRTSLSLIGFGFTIYQFLKKIQEVSGGSVSVRPETPRNFGLAFLIAGTLGTLVALWQHHLYTTYLRGAEFKDIALQEGMPRSSLPVLVTVFLALIGMATTGWVVLAG